MISWRGAAVFRNVFPVGPPLQTAPQLVLWVLGSKKSEKARIHFPNWQSHKSQWHIKGSEMSYNKKTLVNISWNIFWETLKVGLRALGDCQRFGASPGSAATWCVDLGKPLSLPVPQFPQVYKRVRDVLSAVLRVAVHSESLSPPLLKD